MRKSPYAEVHVFFPPALHRRLRLASVEVRLSMQQIIRTAVGEWFDRQERAGVAVPPMPDSPVREHVAEVRYVEPPVPVGHLGTQEVVE